MRLLDTREQKSPRFLLDAFPDIEITPLEVGDYFSGYFADGDKCMESCHELGKLYGNLVEIKIGNDFGIHTEQLERFRDECYRMACYRQKNPHVQCHAVWYDLDPAYIPQKHKLWYHYCQKYHVWGHIVTTENQLIELLKSLDQPSQYQEFEPYIKRSHEEPTDLAKALRQVHGVSSEVAMQLSTCHTVQEVMQIPGMMKKNGHPTKLWDKINTFLCQIASYKDNQWGRNMEAGE